MIVMKFGGTSVGDAERVDRVVDIVSDHLEQDPALVVSAHGGVTDLLIEAAENALDGTVSTKPIYEQHEKFLAQYNDPDLTENVEELLSELEVLLQGISMVGELTPRTRDYVLSFGERLSVRTVASRLRSKGVDAEAVNAYDAGMITNDNFGSAEPLPDSKERIRNYLEQHDASVPVITGFIGKTKEGNITTLGRNGSDYSASYIGAASNASEIQIWSDVEGIMTADPRIVESAKPIRKMSFSEASELAYYGGRIHPSSLVPAIEQDIPIRMLNSFKPESDGTVIENEVTVERNVTSIVQKEGIYLVDITSPNMLARHGFMERIFRIFAEHEIVIDMVSTSEVSVSCTTDSAEELEAATDELSEFCDVTVYPEKAIICVVGEGMRGAQGLHENIFAALNQANIHPQMISQGERQINLSLIVDNDEAKQAVKELHNALF